MFGWLRFYKTFRLELYFRFVFIVVLSNQKFTALEFAQSPIWFLCEDRKERRHWKREWSSKKKELIAVNIKFFDAGGLGIV
jgi:hypothetical protein